MRDRFVSLPMTTEPHNATETVEALEDIARKHPDDGVCIGDVLDEFGHRSFGPFLFVPALIELTPFGAIPGVPTFLALLIATVAVELFLGRDHVTLPRFIQRRRVRSGRLMQAAKKLERIAAWLDKRFHGRLRRFTGRRMQRVAAVFVIILCCTVPPLELLPFASSVPMLAIAAFGLAVLVRDGLLMLMAGGLSVAALTAGGFLVATSDLTDKLG